MDLDEALGKIGRLAYQAWNEGSPSFAEVVEEVVLTCDDLLDGEPERDGIDAILPATWCPDLPFKERLRNLVEARRAWINCDGALQERIRKLEVMANEIGDPPLAVDPDAVARIRSLLRNDPRVLVLQDDLIELLKGVFGVTVGPTHIEPSLPCDNCTGLGRVDDMHFGPMDCVRCKGTGRLPDVDGMRLRIAELEAEQDATRDVIDKAGHYMAWAREPRSPAVAQLFLDLDLALNNYRHCGYENSDHPDDYTAPTWSASDPEDEDAVHTG